MIMNPIGGYFELEFPERRGFPHDDGVLLNSGRNALEYVLLALGNVSNVWVPFYTCDVVLEPMLKLGIPYRFYHINQNLELDKLPSLESGEYLIYTNYFGIKDEYVRELAYYYESQLIVDNAQAWFAKPIDGVNTIYSPRKYVGVPDGGVAYCVNYIDEKIFEQDVSYERCSHLLKRIDLGPSEGYSDFKSNSNKLEGTPIKRMSRLTHRLLSAIDFEAVKNQRMKNFKHLHECLGDVNLFPMPSDESFACPMVYLYQTNDSSLRKKLIEKDVFVATYWPNVYEWCKPEDWEFILADSVAYIPIDQRYDINDMAYIISVLKEV